MTPSLPDLDPALGPAPERGIRYLIGGCRFGSLLIAADTHAVCAIALGDDARAAHADLADRFPDVALTEDPALSPWLEAVAASLDTPGVAMDLPLAPRGTAFQLRVWEALRALPPGTTTTYTDVAAKLGAPTAVRAVAAAIGANPLAVIIPCHRVVGRDGSLTGYRWGLARKRALLADEAQRLSAPALSPPA